MSVRRLLTAATLLAFLVPVGHSQTAQDAYIKASNSEPVDTFGRAVAIEGNTMVISSPEENGGSTGVDGNQSDNSVGGSGAAFVFEKGPNGWIQTAYLKASNTGKFDGFGQAVAISGDTIVIGAPGERSSSPGVNGNEADNSALAAGAVYVFVRSGSTWVQQAYLKASNPGGGAITNWDHFGFDVAISGDVICVGAPGEASNATGINGNGADDSLYRAGAAYVFGRTGTTWAQEAYLKASNTDDWDEFGFSVTASGNTVVVGARYEDSNALGVNGNQSDNSMGNPGAAYIFLRSAGAWTQQAYLKPSNICGGFGWQMDMDGETLAISAPYEDGGSTGVNGDQSDYSVVSSGAVYVFTRTGITWSQEAYLKPFEIDPGISHYAATFGYSVDLDKDRMIVGAPWAQNKLVGVDGRATYEYFLEELGLIGAAYLLERTGSTWHTLSSLASPHPKGGQSFGDGQSFGFDVALSGDSAVVGALGEDGTALGINGTYQSGSPASGAAFTYDLSASCGVFRYGDFAGANTADLSGFWQPTPGSTFTFEYAGFLSGGLGMLVVSALPANVPLLGGTLLIDPGFSVFGPGVITPVQIDFTNPGPSTPGSVSMPIPPGTTGLSFFAQLALFTSSPPLGLTYTNGLEITVCP